MSAIDFAQDTTEQVLETDLWTAVQAWLLEAGTRLLAVAAGFVLLLWPESVAGPSFQMSFAAVLALVPGLS